MIKSLNALKYAVAALALIAFGSAGLALASDDRAEHRGDTRYAQNDADHASGKRDDDRREERSGYEHRERGEKEHAEYRAGADPEKGENKEGRHQ